MYALEAFRSRSTVSEPGLSKVLKRLVPLAEKLLEVPTNLVHTALYLELADGTVIAIGSAKPAVRSSPGYTEPSEPSPSASSGY